MTNVIEFKTRKTKSSASKASKASKPSKSDIPPFSDFFEAEGSTSEDRLSQCCSIQYADMWEALERDAPERIPEILQYEPRIMGLLYAIVIAKEWQQPEVALELLKTVEKYIKTGTSPTVASVSPKARGFIYDPPKSQIFAVQCTFV